MAYRGRGRGGGWGGRGGGGGGGGGYRFAKQEPYQIWPEVELPDVNDVKEEKNLMGLNWSLLRYWKSSPYHLEDSVTKKRKSIDIERYSDWGKPKISGKRDALDQFLLLGSNNFPKELVGDSKRGQPNPKKVRWNQDADLQRLDFLEKRELMHAGLEEKGEKEAEDEDEDENEEDEEDSEEDNGDYEQNQDFDDDEDDYNMNDSNDDEPTY
ncbi:RNA_pol_3_Rpc31 domain-containing protein [Cephalotus follicularis]|uniref:RNA_pol_3_Rpc31 domain-containing protein n=1 Tax=Cephalotus follicularis TaxID=3775 RepID=A0A1Q3C744_CEPFO|nr:RNA_pol_3_Rpc31 domain-containing protein [Cephalotus follicularis]